MDAELKLEEAARIAAEKIFFVSPQWKEAGRELFKAGAQWKEYQITKNNMLLPFKEYDNLMESVNKQKKEGYEAGYKKGLEDAKEDTIRKVRNWLEDNFYYSDTIEEKYEFIKDLCEALENETTG